MPSSASCPGEYFPFVKVTRETKLSPCGRARGALSMSVSWVLVSGEVSDHQQGELARGSRAASGWKRGPDVRLAGGFGKMGPPAHQSLGAGCWGSHNGVEDGSVLVWWTGELAKVIKAVWCASRLGGRNLGPVPGTLGPGHWGHWQGPEGDSGFSSDPCTLGLLRFGWGQGGLSWPGAQASTHGAGTNEPASLGVDLPEMGAVHPTSLHTKSHTASQHSSGKGQVGRKDSRGCA